MLGRILTACIVVTLSAASPATAQGNIADVFREFEAICFAYGTDGYSNDVRLELENRGYNLSARSTNGSDYFTEKNPQVMIGPLGCAFGIYKLDFATMANWTTEWMKADGLAFAGETKNSDGGRRLAWNSEGFTVALSDDKANDGTPVTTLLVERAASSN